MMLAIEKDGKFYRENVLLTLKSNCVALRLQLQGCVHIQRVREDNRFLSVINAQTLIKVLSTGGECKWIA
jgi:hypothetical protein